MCTNIYDDNDNDEDDICDDNHGCELDKHGVANMIHIVMVKMMMMMVMINDIDDNDNDERDDCGDDDDLTISGRNMVLRI